MRTRAIILKKQNTGEYDQLVTCYTEEFGKITAVAKSILKPSSIQAMHLDVFNLVDFELINGRAAPIITGAQAEQTHSNLKNNLASLATAYFFAETADRIFFEYQKDDKLWKFFTSLLEELNDGHHRLLLAKQIEFLNILGYAPNTEECAFCAVPMADNIMAYSPEARGAVCQSCFMGDPRGIVVRNNDLLTRPIIGAIFESLTEKKLHSLNFLNSMLK